MSLEGYRCNSRVSLAKFEALHKDILKTNGAIDR